MKSRKEGVALLPRRQPKLVSESKGEATAVRERNALAPASDVSVLATKVRTLRAQKGLTLRELATRTRMSASALSKIEKDQLSPTYEKILSLAEGLSVDVSELFSQKAKAGAGGRRTITRRGQGVTSKTSPYDYEFLCADLWDKHFVPVLAQIKAHSLHEFPELPHHEGEEFVFVLRGSVILHTEFYAPLHMDVGDSCYFDSVMGHALIAKGDEDADVLWVWSKNVKFPA